MTTALLELEAAGYDAAELREHSVGWLTQALLGVRRRRRQEQASLLTFEVLAAALGAGSKDAADEIDELMERLTAPDEDESASHLLDPNAQTDWTALHSSGMVTRVKVAVPTDPAVPTEDPDDREGREGTDGAGGPGGS